MVTAQCDPSMPHYVRLPSFKAGELARVPYRVVDFG
jgi:hypothetical protein